MDIFESYIKKYQRNEDCRALTCKSYGKVYQNKYCKKLEPGKTNFELATYGDALLKFALCSILLDNGNNLTEEKKKYENDRYLIEVVAKHYDLLDYMNFDRDDEKIPQTYEVSDKGVTKYKYIATTVEAVLGAIYKESRDFDSICVLVESWIKLQNNNPR